MALQTSMDIFCGSELAFQNTYFSCKHSRTVHIKTDAPVQSLVSTEVPQSAGSFSFPSEETELANRFIIWRADGSNLFLDEVSAERDLQNSSICINFSQSIIIPGTKLLFSKHVLLLVVPCQSAIHLFNIYLTGDPDKRLTISQSVFINFPSDADLPLAHTFHHFKNNGVAAKVDATLSSASSIAVLVGVCLHDKQLVAVTFQSSANNQNCLVSDEVVLQGNNMFNRIFKGKSAWSDTWDVAVVGDGAQASVYSVHQDGMIRCWNGNSQCLNFTADILDFLQEETNPKVLDISLKATKFSKDGSDFVILRVQIADHNRFILLENVRNQLKFRFSSKLESKFVIDFLCTHSSGSQLEGFCFWAIVNVSFTGEQEDGVFQPYALTKCDFSLTGIQDGVWEEVQSAGTDTKMNSLLFKFSETEAVKNRIFDGNNYSFSVVNRAVQIACKQPKQQFEQNDWLGLADFVQEFIESGHFKQIYLNSEDGSSLLKFNTLKDDKLKVAVDKFWNDLLKCCNQLQEADLQPLSFVYSPNLGLIGVIQLCRFTVYLPPDELMRAICQPNNKVVSKFFEIVKPFLKTGHVPTSMDVNSTLETITNHTDELCRVIRAFAEHRPVDVANNLADAKSDFLASSFSTGFLATSLRHRIMGRLRLADVINKLVSIVPQILAISTEARTNPRLDLVISAHNSTISQIISYYAVMWIALSVRLVSQRSSERKVTKQVCVAQAYFKYGGSSLVKKLPNAAKFIDQGVDGEGDEDDDDDEDDIMGFRPVLPPSKWDETSYFSSPSSSSKHQRPVKEKPFESFVREVIAGSIITLWPESTSLTLPRFLAENGFFDALKNYCSLNEPFVSELAYALRFFQGISYSGLGKPEIAWKAFEEISLGVLTGDDALNSLLGLIMYSNDTQAITEPKKHSLAEYYNEVMLLFKAHGHTKYVILAGDKAVQCAKDNDPLLPEIFTTLFTQQLVSKNFREALRTLLINPSKEKQSACLRQLLTFLVDSGDTRTLVDLSYDHLTDVVVDILETRCRSDSVSNSAVSDIYDVVFAFHVSRWDYGKAAKIMYEYANRLKEEIQTRELLEKRCRVLSVAFETLGIAEPGKNVVQFEVELRGHKNHGEASSSINLDTDEDQMDASTSNTYPSERLLTLTIEDIGRELVQAEARLELLDVDQLSVPPTNYEDILRESLKHKRYDMAWVIIREFGLHPYDLLEEVTKQAILADHYLSSVGECDTEWALANRQFLVKTRGKHASHWKVVISYVELALQHWPHDTKILRTVAYVFLGYSVQIPAWLETQYKALNFGDFLCSLTDFGDLEDAFKQLLSELDAAIRKVTAGKLDIIVPYSHIDRLFDLAKKVDGGHLPVEETRKKISKFSSLYDSIRKATSVI